MEPIRVLLVEDNDVYRDALAFLLGRLRGLEVVGAVGTAGAAPRRVRRARASTSPSSTTACPTSTAPRRRPRSATRCPETAIVFLSASAGAEEHERRAAPASSCPEGRGRRRARRRDARGGGKERGVNLTTENTAIVLDSTSDYPEAP